MCEVLSVYIHRNACETEKRDGGVADCGGMREYGVRTRGQTCSVSRQMKD